MTPDQRFIHDMVWGFGKPPWICMIKAYMDESGYEDGGKVCVVAGFAGNEAQWQSFVEDWKIGLGRKRHLHMTELRWNGPKRFRTEELLSRLGPIPVKHGLQRICAEVNHGDYQEYVRPNADDPLAEPWMIAFQIVLIRTLQWLPLDETIKFIFEDQRRYSRYAEFLHRAVFEQRKFDRRLVGIEFVGKNTTACTEAADYLAFIVHETVTNPGSVKARMGRSILEPEGDAIGERYSTSQMQQWGTGIAQIHRTLLK